jgi:glycosyltransferase involved in cell wall biosynthesis
MRILQVSPAYFPAISIGGPIFSMLALAKVLCKDHDVDTLTTQLGLRESNSSAPRYNHFEREPCGSRVIYRRYYGYPNLTFSPGTMAWLVKELNHYDLAVLHGVWNFPIGAAALMCQWHHVPYVIFPHGTLYRETIDLHSARAKRLMLKLYVRRMLEHAARIAFTTNDEARQVTCHLGFNLRPFIVPNIVEAADFAKLPPRGLFRARHNISATAEMLLHYGRITRKKGLEFAVKALAALRRQGRNVVLAIVGGDDDGYKAKVQAMAADLRVEDAVIFAGLLGREEGKTALVDADIFVLPSHSENFGMAVVEAMLCLLPVVVSENVGLAEDLARADVGVVIRLDPDAGSLTQALTALLDNKTRRESLGIRGRQFAIENYDANAVRDQVNELLNSALGKVPRF